MNKFKPTNKKPLGKMGKKLDKQFSDSNIDLTEVDAMLTEKEQSFKKKFWDLPKMETLVHSDPILSVEYQEMSEDGQEKYGYHYNETIMNMLFNKYVTHDQGYQQKYLNAIPAKKERRDKSGIHQLQQKGEEKMKNKNTSKSEKTEGEIHNNSLEGVIEEDMMDNNLNTDGGGTFDDREYLNHRIDKNNNTMQENTNKKISNELASWFTGTVLNNIIHPQYGKHKLTPDQIRKTDGEYKNQLFKKIQSEINKGNVTPEMIAKFNHDVDETTGAASSGAFSTALGAKNNVYEGEDGEEEQIDETTTSASSGAYEGPFHKKTKDHITNKPAWSGGEIVDESYLINTKLFKEIFNFINESFGEPNDDSLVGLAEFTNENTDNAQPNKSIVTPDMVSKLNNEQIQRSLSDLLRHKDGNINDEGGLIQMFQNELVKRGILYKPKSPTLLQKFKKFLTGVDFRDDVIKLEGINEHHLDTREEKIEFILNNGQENLFDPEMLNHVDDEGLDRIYKSLENSLPTIPSYNDRYMQEDEVNNFASTKHDGLPNKVDEAGGKKFFSFDEAMNLANMLDNSPVEEEENIITSFASKYELSLTELKYQLEKHIQSRLAGSDSPDYFKMENVITILNDMYDQKNDITQDMKDRVRQDKEEEIKMMTRKPNNKMDAASKEVIKNFNPLKSRWSSSNTSEDEMNEDLSQTVQYHSEKTDEEPFDVNGTKWQEVWAIYPDGKKNIGYYRYGHDLVYSSDYFDNVILGNSAKVNENPLLGMAARGAGAAIANNLMSEDLNGQTVDQIATLLQKIMPNQYNNIEGYRKFAHLTVKTFFGGDYNKALQGIKTKMGSLFNRNEGIISGTEGSIIGDNGTTMAATMKDVQSGGMNMNMGEGEKVHDLNKNGRSNDVKFDNENSLDGFGKSKDGIGGFNDVAEPIKNYKQPDKFGAPRNKDLSKYNKITESKESVCENCGSPLDEDGHCRRDEYPVAGKIAGEKGSCKKKKTRTNKTDDNKFNVEFRKKKEKEMEHKRDKSHDDYKKEIEKSKKHMKKLKEMVEGVEPISEDKRPSALVQMDRLHKDNKKNFNSDLKDSNTTDVAKDELTAQKQIEEVPENPYDLAEKIEKEKMKEHNYNSFDNDGNSTNDTNKDIPKRNMTDDEADDLMLNRGLGMQDIVYDNKPDERFEKRMEKDMGEQIYDQRKEKIKFRADAPMYNKDSQPIDDGKHETQFDNNVSKFNNPKGIKENVSAKYTDEFGKRKVITFDINEAVEVKTAEGIKLSFDGMGNTYNSSVVENVKMRDLINSFNFYMNGNKVVKVKSGRQSLTENVDGKKPINEEVQKMMKLAGYNPSKHVSTLSTKKNAKFNF